MKTDEITNKTLFLFWRKVIVRDSGDCWEWMGSKLRRGYGGLNINNHTVQAHRLSYMIHYGEIPDGLLVCHTCDNPSCVNPNHLFLGDYFDNARDRCNKMRQAKEETCPQTKFSIETIKSIRQEYSFGNLSMRAIARKYGVAYSHINRILHGVNRKYAY